jgi:glycosyltransferase involved in cell wall biosynthesis
MKVLPKISIVTPSFNQAEFLEQTIESVLSQGYPNLEYFVMDGGSNDRSVEIIKKYESHLAGWVSEKDRGQSHAINKGLNLSTGDVFNWLNSDDYYEQGTLQKVGEYFSDPDLNVLCGRSRLFGEGLPSRISPGTDIYPNQLAKTIGQARIDQPETFFRKQLINKIGVVNENLHYLMDRELWIRYLLVFGLNGIKQIPDILVNFRLHNLSKTVSQASKFEKERDDLYFTLASTLINSDESNHFELCFSDSKVLESCDFQIHNAELIRLAIQYFFMLKADELFFQKKFKVAREVLDFEKMDEIRKDRIFKKLNSRLLFPDVVLRLMYNLKS